MNIKERIIAVFVLQRFVRMSRLLLPIYLDLSSKSALTTSDKRRLVGIRQVYENFDADPLTSNYLINSNILSLIQKVYQWNSSQNNQTPQSLYEYDMFIEESDRLIFTWDKQLMN